MFFIPFLPSYSYPLLHLIFLLCSFIVYLLLSYLTFFTQVGYKVQTKFIGLRRKYRAYIVTFLFIS